MRSPFPGMDPYIEGSELWEDFHTKLIGDIERYLSETLPPQYVVRLGERTYVDFVDPLEEEPTLRRIIPHVNIRSRVDHLRSAESATAVVEAEPQWLVMQGLIEAEFRELFIEIKEFDPEDRLVTCIEVLSPGNKQPRTSPESGWRMYQRKRSIFLRGHANLVELDLLRGGQRMPMVDPWPSSPYAILVLRKHEAPSCRVLPAHFREPLPTVPIPLSPPDPDAKLDLQPIVDAIYLRSRHHSRIRYDRPLRPPLDSGDAAWLRQRLDQTKAS